MAAKIASENNMEEEAYSESRPKMKANSKPVMIMGRAVWEVDGTSAIQHATTHIF